MLRRSHNSAQFVDIPINMSTKISSNETSSLLANPPAGVDPAYVASAVRRTRSPDDAVAAAARDQCAALLATIESHPLIKQYRDLVASSVPPTAAQWQDLARHLRDAAAIDLVAEGGESDNLLAAANDCVVRASTTQQTGPE